MAQFLSSEWVAQLDQAVQASSPLHVAMAEVDLTIQQVVTNDATPDDAETAWHIAVDRGTVRVHAGRTAEPGVTFTQDRDTALAVGRGELSAQAAFMLGKLRLGGDVSLLMTHQSAFMGLEDVFADVRAHTTY
ncbi:MAG: SCP2 sterol-binding domain-containing protein [Acidimicrobiales bacterium]